MTRLQNKPTNSNKSSSFNSRSSSEPKVIDISKYKSNALVKLNYENDLDVSKYSE